MPINTPIGKLESLGVFQSGTNFRDDAAIFEKCRTMAEIGNELGSRHLQSGSNQFVYWHLEALFKTNPEYKACFLDEAIRQFEDSGISSEYIIEYLSNQGRTGGIEFIFEHEEEYGLERMNIFFEKADQFALTKFRAWLGYV